MKAFFLTGSAALLLACGVTVFPAMAGGKIVNLTLRVLVDGPPPCSVKGSAVEFGNVIIKSIDGANYRQPVGYTLNCSNSVSDDLQMQLQATTTTINGETVLSTESAVLAFVFRMPLTIRWWQWVTVAGCRSTSILSQTSKPFR